LENKNENEFDMDFDGMIDEIFSDLAGRDNKDYVVNPEQAFKLIKAYNFIKEIVDEFPEDNVLYPSIIEPKRQSGCLSAELSALILVDESKIKTLAKIVDNCCVIDITPKTNGKVSIEIAIPDVYIKKEN